MVVRRLKRRPPKKGTLFALLGLISREKASIGIGAPRKDY